MASSGSNKRPGSGNRRPKPAAVGSSAAERARERVQSQAGRPARGGQQVRRSQGKRPQARSGSRSSAMTAGIFGGGLVVVAVVVIVLISSLGGGGGSKAAGHDPYIKPFPITAQVEKALTSVPGSALASAGTGGTGVYSVSSLGPKASGANIVRIGSVPATGKPVIQYVGAEYCPFCAATRWPLVIALSKFGHFTGLEQTASSPIDAYGDTHTLTFAKASYSSPYLSFKAVEETTNECRPGSVIANSPGSTPPYVCNNGNYIPLQTPTKAEIALINKYDNTTWFGALDSSGPGIPFIVFGRSFAESGALYDPQILQGANWDQIVGSFKVPNTGIGQTILAAAKQYIGMICVLTHDKPATVCGASYLKPIEKTYR